MVKLKAECGKFEMEVELVVAVLGNLRQKDFEFKTSLGCMFRPCVKEPRDGDTYITCLECSSPQV